MKIYCLTTSCIVFLVGDQTTSNFNIKISVSFEGEITDLDGYVTDNFMNKIKEKIKIYFEQKGNEVESVFDVNIHHLNENDEVVDTLCSPYNTPEEMNNKWD